MQTFLPYSSFIESVRCLDRQRLGKQRVEALQILNALNGKSKGWTNHPATKMWRGYEEALCLYKDLCIQEWMQRGYKNTMSFKKRDALYWQEIGAEGSFLLPPWIGQENFHASHRSNLLRKNPDHYGQFGWDEPHDLPYVWPDKKP